MTGTSMWRAASLAAWLAVAAPASAQEASVERVRTLPPADRPLEIELTDVYRLGDVGAADWQQFGNVRAVAFGPDGRLYVLDQQADAVHAVGPDGRRIGSIGRAGEGPGEYRVPTGLTVGPDGAILVRDTGNGSLVLFDASGEYVENVRPDASEGQASSVVLAPGGWLVGTPSLLYMGATGSSELTARYLVGRGESVEAVDGLPLVRVHMRNGDPMVLDRLWIPPRNADDGSLAQMAFLPRAHWAVLPDGSVAIADSTTWEVRIRGAHVGGTDTRITRAIEPAPVTDRMREQELERRAREGPQGGGGVVAFGESEEARNEALARARERQLEATVHFFPEIQVIQGLRADPAGRLWVARAGADLDQPGPIDVLGPDGAYLGTVEGMTLPDAFGPDGLAAWVEAGELDVPVVVVRRVAIEG